ncbi:MAG: nucleotidyltransferase domain-containing protein [Candidatus Schekmanbacteria bacterium]|nr:nucleotidyltransferase domain-containing protein [Candidatus Schekmanbacteria bacterium]
MNNTPNIQLSYATIAEFCRKNHILKFSLFGSVLSARFTPDSDVDVLVEFEPEHIPGLFSLAGMEVELSNILKREVELRTKEDLSRYFRDNVVSSAKVIYERK